MLWACSLVLVTFLSDLNLSGHWISSGMILVPPRRNWAILICLWLVSEYPIVGKVCITHGTAVGPL